MVRRTVLFIFFLVLLAVQSFGQIRMSTLSVGKKETYKLLGSDIIVVDTLILHDSATLVLNNTRKDNFIHAKKLVIGNGATISGRGSHGQTGKEGIAGGAPEGPCKDGYPGLSGKPGGDGGQGVNLFLYIEEIKATGKFTIDLAGGDGGDGGQGGRGSNGNAGTRLCQGGSGGAGGNGGTPGNGGNAGNLTLTSPFGTDMRNRLSDLVTVRSFGGFAGQGGEGGLPGSLGLSPAKDGNTGKKGTNGADGKPGQPGGVFYERK